MASTRRLLLLAAVTTFFAAGLLAAGAQAQVIVQSRGVDSRVDYGSLARFGPWDDRNYGLTLADLSLLADNEAELSEAIPAFYRIYLRRHFPDLMRTGPAQYPRSGLPRFRLEHGGYLVDGQLYRRAVRRNGRFEVILENGVPEEHFLPGFGPTRGALTGEVRVTSPVGAAESAVAINPVDPEIVIAGSNGPASGQNMHFSTDGGETWSPAPALPLGGTCCDPTVAWSSDGSLAYTATLGAAVFFYRSADGGQTWTDLTNEPPGGDPRREIGSGFVDKEYLHVDTSPTSPHQDNIYLTWHQGNIMQFARSTDSGHTWATQAFSSAQDQRGIGSDITTDAAGNVYYIWPAFNSQRIWVRKSTDGGVGFDPPVEVAQTEGSFIFPVPSMEFREVFIYVAADTDRTGGPFHGSIYASWTDSTAATTGNPTTNHARIQVAYSRNGGATWNLSTPHETVDQNTVDRWHQWLSVGPDGTVHVIFYDTRRDPTRSSVDLFWSRSTDGAVTWSTPERLTSEISPNIADGFEFGDYNGLDVVLGRLIAVFTDNRSEGGGGGDSVDVYAAGRELSEIFTDGFESGDTSAWSRAVP
jgi:hypothetical protein